MSSILLKSRKRDITIAYTTQSIHQVVKRIRDITDFIAYPIMSPDDSTCKVVIFRGGSGKPTPINQPPIYYNCEPVYAMFNTREEIKPVEETTTPFEEVFLPITQNYAFIEYLKAKGVPNNKIIAYCNAIQNTINPHEITSESQRERNEVFSPI